MIARVNPRLVFVGHIGIDAYIAEDHAVYVRPAGSAYNAACGILAVGGEATVVATSSPSFNRAFLEKFARSKIRILDQVTEPGPDHFFLFDLRHGGAGQQSSPIISLGRPAEPPVECLRQNAFQDLHIHLGTMAPDEMVSVWQDARAVKPTASFSCNLYEPYIAKGWDRIAQVAEACSIVFMNYEEFAYLREHGDLNKVLAGRLVLMTCGDLGVVCYVDGIPYFGYTPEYREAVCAIGAGDVLAGVFLGLYLKGRPLSAAVATAAEAASISVLDYGVDGVPRNREALRSVDQNPMPTPRMTFAPPARFRPSAATFERVTEASAVLAVRDGRALLVRKPDHKAFVPGLLYVPGGKLAAGETPEGCARRELREETGLEGGSYESIGTGYFINPRDPGQLYRFYQFLATDTTGEPVARDDVRESAWVPLESVARADLFEMTWALIWLLRLGGHPLGAASRAGDRAS